MRRSEKVSKAAINRSKAQMKKREQHLGRVELVHKLQKAGETQRARHLVRNLRGDIDRMEGDLVADRWHGGMTMHQRAVHTASIANLRRQMANALINLALR